MQNKIDPVLDVPSVYRCNNHNAMHHLFDFLLEQNPQYSKQQASATIIQAYKVIDAFKYFLSDEFDEMCSNDNKNYGEHHGVLLN